MVNQRANVVVVCVGSLFAYAGVTATWQAEPPAVEAAATGGDVEVDVSVSPTAIKGLPLVAGVRVVNRTKKVEFPPLKQWLKLPEEERRRISQRDALARLTIPIYGLLSEHPPPFSVEIYDHGGARRVAATQPSLYAFFTADWRVIHGAKGEANPFRFMRPTIEVGSGDTRIFLVDLAPWIDGLPAGDYELILYVHRGWEAEGIPSARVPLQLRDLDAAHRELIEKTVPAQERNGPSRWLSKDLDCELLLILLPAEVYQHLAIYCLVQHPGAVLTPEASAGMPDHLERIGGVIAYEALLAAGEDAAAETLRVRIIGERPDLVVGFDRVKQGGGLLQLPRPRDRPAETPPKSGVAFPPRDGGYQHGDVTQHAAFVALEDAERLRSSSSTEVTFEDARWRTGDWRDEVKGRRVVVLPLEDGRYQRGVVDKHGAFIPFKDAEPLPSSWHGPPIYGMRPVDRIDDVSMDNILLPLWRRLLDDLQQDHPDGSALIRDLEELLDHLERMTPEN